MERLVELEQIYSNRVKDAKLSEQVLMIKNTASLTISTILLLPIITTTTTLELRS